MTDILTTPDVRAQLMKRKTKIIATLGPASHTPEVIRELIVSGMNVARLNFSHGKHEDHGKVLRIVREEAARLGRHVAVFQDLCGPKVRIGEVEGGELRLTDGEAVTLRHFKGQLGTTKEIFVEAFDPVNVLKPGEKALLSDGKVQFTAQKVTPEGVECVVVAGGIVRSRSGIAVPDSKLLMDCITEKDIRDVKWAVENDIDYVAISFVRSAKDIQQLREIMAKQGRVLPIIAKIERAEALDHLSQIVQATDAIMIARGDLGLELPLERVPGAQRFIIDQSNFHGRPVITATQMLLSMVTELRPTRAEVTDVYTAVRDGTDAVMLSDETAIGKHPVEAVRVLHRIVLEAERELDDEIYRRSRKASDSATIPDAVCYAATSAAAKVGASAVIVCTQSGETARLMSKYRPKQPLYAVTSEERSLSRLAFHWGVIPVLMELPGDSGTEEEINLAMSAVRNQFGLKPGSRVVITAGLRTKSIGTTNVMEIREIPRTA